MSSIQFYYYGRLVCGTRFITKDPDLISYNDVPVAVMILDKSDASLVEVRTLPSKISFISSGQRPDIKHWLDH